MIVNPLPAREAINPLRSASDLSLAGHWVHFIKRCLSVILLPLYIRHPSYIITGKTKFFFFFLCCQKYKYYYF
ncbi:hypothetical protein XELAEV_18003345mg [Xenopus laevis]|nr:hypothetical protein XELAEV_18003345mg [Xenopus laevis]